MNSILSNIIRTYLSFLNQKEETHFQQYGLYDAGHYRDAQGEPVVPGLPQGKVSENLVFELWDGGFDILEPLFFLFSSHKLCSRILIPFPSYQLQAISW